MKKNTAVTPPKKMVRFGSQSGDGLPNSEESRKLPMDLMLSLKAEMEGLPGNDYHDPVTQYERIKNQFNKLKKYRSKITIENIRKTIKDTLEDLRRVAILIRDTYSVKEKLLPILTTTLATYKPKFGRGIIDFLSNPDVAIYEGLILEYNRQEWTVTESVPISDQWSITLCNDNGSKIELTCKGTKIYKKIDRKLIEIEAPNLKFIVVGDSYCHHGEMFIVPEGTLDSVTKWMDYFKEYKAVDFKALDDKYSRLIEIIKERLNPNPDAESPPPPKPPMPKPIGDE